MPPGNPAIRLGDFDRGRSVPNWSSTAEFWLVTLVGLSLPLADIPFFVWRGFGVDLAHISGSLLILTATAGAVFRSRGRPNLVLSLVATGLLLVPLLPYVFYRLPGFSVEHFWRSFAHLAFMLAVFLVLSSANFTTAQFDSILAILVCEGVILALYGIWQTLAYSHGWPTGIGLLNHLSREPMRGGFFGVWRATATFAEPRYLANHLLTAIVSAAWLARKRYNRDRRTAAARWVAALIVMGAGILFTMSLGGIAALLILVAGMAAAVHRMLTRRARLIMTGGLGLLALLVALYAGASGDSVSRRLRERLKVEIESPAESLYSLTAPYFSRGFYLHNARYALLVTNDSPFVGIGVGQFAAVGNIRGKQLGFPGVVSGGGSWVGVTGMVAEFGLAGVLLFMILFLALSQNYPRVPGRPSTTFRFLSLWLLAAVGLEELGPGFYIHLWMWFPLGLSALGRYISVQRVANLGLTDSPAGDLRRSEPDLRCGR
ncbi:MAG: hypothetical protein LC796_13585 [Acidobacteria bacterium]|nr:hypothetical protein [Acidobacteriota bacterium]MCA1610562.1 hypothetical protein [Acidobacteriota bacterium]